MDYFSLDFFDFDEDDWWDSYYDYQDEKDAYWQEHYSKVYHSLPDSRNIPKLQVYHRRRSNILCADEPITYEKLYSIIIKIDGLFSLWQKRLSHEWNKDVKRPCEKPKDPICNKISSDAKTDTDNGKSSESQATSNHICPQLQQAVNMIEEECRMYNHMQHILSDYEDDDEEEEFDDYGSFDYLDSDDDWDSSIDEEFYSYSDEDFYEHKFRMQMQHRKHKKEAQRSVAIKQYLTSAEKYYSAFPTAEDASDAMEGIVMLKSWIAGLCKAKLTKYIGHWLPDLVLEKILGYLYHSFIGDLSMKIEYVAKTEKFIDVEKFRMKELYAALHDIHSLLFEILFKNHCTANTIYLKEYFVKVFEIAIRKMTVLDDLHSWLLSGPEEDGGEKKNYDVMSGICYKTVFKETAKNFDYFLNLSDAYSYLDGDRLAVLIPCGLKEGFVRVYDIHSGTYMHTHLIDKLDVPLAMAIHGKYLALVLKSDSVANFCVYDLENDQEKVLTHKIGDITTECIHSMFFVEINGSLSLTIQYKENILIIDIGEDLHSPKITKEYEKMKLLAVKDHFMIAKDLETPDQKHPISTAKKVAEISKKIVGVKIFDLNKKSLLQVVEHPTAEKDRPYYLGVPKWSVAIDSNAESTRFLLWHGEVVQLWDLKDGVKKIKDIDLGRRVSSGTKLSLNKNIIMVQNVQKSHDSNYDTIDLAEFLFYDIDSSKVCFFETFHNMYEHPDSNIAAPGGPFFARHFTDDMLILLHASSSGGEIRFFRFNLDAKAIISLQTAELIEKRREEERLRLIKEAEKKRIEEERRKRKEAQRQKWLQKKQEKKSQNRKKQHKIDEIRRIERTGTFVEGVVTDWRGTYGFMQVPNIGSVFIHRSDILGRSFVNYGSRIQCRIQEQVDHPRPKAVFATVV